MATIENVRTDMFTPDLFRHERAHADAAFKGFSAKQRLRIRNLARP
jgi:hypothetical protein